MKNLLYPLLAINLLLFACTSPETKNNINKVGDAAGQAVGEFVEGVTHGVEKAFDVKVDVPQNLAGKGIHFGKTYVTNANDGTDNLLLIYMIFDNDFSGDLTAKAFDNKGLEMGRVTVKVTGNKNEARFIEFHFDKHTNIDSDCRLTIE
jgi:hypothetical protein